MSDLLSVVLIIGVVVGCWALFNLVFLGALSCALFLGIGRGPGRAIFYGRDTRGNPRQGRWLT